MATLHNHQLTSKPKHVGFQAAVLVLIASALIFTMVHGAERTSASAAVKLSITKQSVYSGGLLMSSDPNGGYWTVNGAGQISSFGGAPLFGSPAISRIPLAKPIVGMAPTADGQGYWLVASDGGVFSFGDARFFGSTGAIKLNAPIVGMAPTADGQGYWLVASDGGVFSFGDARFSGSTGALKLNNPVMGIARTADGQGYWLVASDGGVFSFGDARFFGSTGAIKLNAPIIGMASSPDGQGYWLVASDGGIFNFGDAKFYGSMGGKGATIIGIIVDPIALDYSLITIGGASSVFPSPSINKTGTTTTTQPERWPQQGVYVSSPDPARIATFAAATKTTPNIASDYLPSNNGWLGMDGAGGSLSNFIQTWEGTGYTLSLGVPIIPTNPNGTAAGTLATGATGAYNNYFLTLGQTLVAGGESNADLRLGFEFDIGSNAWSAKTQATEAAFAIYFQQIVNTMRKVPNENFKFIWNPDASAFTSSTVDVKLAYPGSAYVDYIGVDAYDAPATTSSETPATFWQSNTLPELTAAHQFALGQGRPMSIPEWGVVATNAHGFGDDPLYMNDFYAWMTDPLNSVVYESYFNADGVLDSAITGGIDPKTNVPFTYSYPNSLAAFRADFG
ncbi:MAG TPA: glycosyl hydrolase [Acidimicrobiales bacterium]|jgi:hypothetical protein|nr:glycosyl hydrolase [Acidimicrobiales bacterium]